MRTYLAVMLLPMLLLFTSCGTMSSLSEKIGEARDVVVAANETAQKVQPEIQLIKELVGDIGEIAESLGPRYQVFADDFNDFKAQFESMNSEQKAAADKDGDGELSWSEMLLYAMGAGGGGLVLLRKYLQRLKLALAAEASAGVQGAVNEAIKQQTASAKAPPA